MEVERRSKTEFPSTNINNQHIVGPREGGLSSERHWNSLSMPALRVNYLVKIHKPLNGRPCYLHFTDEETEVERAWPSQSLGSDGAGAWPRSGGLQDQPWPGRLGCGLYRVFEVGHLYAVLLPLDLCSSPWPSHLPTLHPVRKDIVSSMCCGSWPFPVCRMLTYSKLTLGRSLPLCTLPFSIVSW